MNKLKMEELMAMIKANDLLKKEEDDNKPCTLVWILAAIGAVVAVAGIAYAVYRYFTPDYLEDFEDDFDDDFFDDEEEEAETIAPKDAE